MLKHRFLALLFVALAICAPARAEDLTPEKKADIEQLLAMTGAMALGKQMATGVMASISQSLKKSHPEIPEGVFPILAGEVLAVFDENLGSFKEDVIPLYHKYFTAEDIKALIAFYSSDIGQKAVKSMPAMLQESFMLGQRWSQSLGPQIDRRVREKLRQQGVQI